MRQRINVLWGILVTLLVACMIWIGYSNYTMSKKVEALKKERISLGTDEQLRETVSTLERNLEERLAYTTDVENNPLDLTKVITSKKFLASLGLKETIEQQGRMRLSCTVLADRSSAVIKFMGRSHVVREGDTFNGFLVEKINQAEMVLSKDGAHLVLYNETAPENELPEGMGSSISGSNL